MEKAWKEGDDEREVEHEFEHQRRTAAKVQRRKGFDMSDINAFTKKMNENPLEYTVTGNANGGGSMFFIELTKRNKKGNKQTNNIKQTKLHVIGSIHIIE